ncbi:hypothetical protein PR202_gb09219 [Eleusine coracana subsp. coracana]|uniref:GATA-type domain-containing protein n=1 Tax=Eleusine coracana subsp. coracana TaxID=191504 RepID=A0AAV5EH86_ELECO|nr:hypothetical protein PR202_gb09219 [Eleusine coracana subsp. coracana]
MASFVAHHHGSLMERDMAALRSSHRPCEAAEEVAAVGPAAWGAGDRGLFGEGFSVEDLLDLEDLCEVDKDVAALGEAKPSPAVEEDKMSSDSHDSSVVSYELMPLPPPVMDLPAHDAEELEWVSRIMDDSLAELPPAPHLALRRQHQHDLATPPTMVPVPTPTVCALSTEALVPVKAKRSKRSRGGSVWSLSGAASLSDHSTSSSSTTSSCSSSSAASFPPLLLLDSSPYFPCPAPPPLPRAADAAAAAGQEVQVQARQERQAQETRAQAQAPPGGAQHDVSGPATGDRRCSHCGVQKTPQWRAGPEGAKTLCNACGVRYKSGRLLPEYRPACSPTFVSSIHSNSHRRVLEMRRKKEGVLVPLPLPAPPTAPAVASF